MPGRAGALSGAPSAAAGVAQVFRPAVAVILRSKMTADMSKGSYHRLLTPPKGSFFLFGLRGIGKSTWARAQFPGAHVIDLLNETHYQTLLANPGQLASELRALPSSRPVVLDEVQRVPALLNEVHRAIEATRRRFVLLGSSARRLKTATTNLLAGRATLARMAPLVPQELGRDFDLDRVLRFGSIPLVWQADDPRATPRLLARRWKATSASCGTRYSRRSYRRSNPSCGCASGSIRNSTGSTPALSARPDTT